jgi:mycothiol system anti-sigma-R factor
VSHDRTHGSCEEVMERLWGFIDGELSAETSSRVREHLDECARCCPCHEFHAAFVQFLRHQARQPVPAGLRRRVFEELLREERRRA